MILSVGNASGANLYSRISAPKSAPAGSSFAGRQVSSNLTGNNRHEVWMPTENCIHSSGDCYGQIAYVEYTADSTLEDPIFRIRGKSVSGDYDETIHLKDIDPRNASYPELCAYMAHQQKIGAVQTPENQLLRALPNGVDRGDYSKRRNFMDSIRGDINHNRQYRNFAEVNFGEQLLEIYQKLIDQQLGATDENQLDALLDYADHIRAAYAKKS